MTSGPADLFGFKLLNLFSTSSFWIFTMVSSSYRSFGGNVGGSSFSEVNTDENWASRLSALSLSLSALVLPTLSIPMPSLVLVWSLANFQNILGLDSLKLYFFHVVSLLSL